METCDPFYIKCIAIYTESYQCKLGILCINPNEYVEVIFLFLSIYKNKFYIL